MMLCLLFFKQKTAYERRISDWSSDVCSSDLFGAERVRKQLGDAEGAADRIACHADEAHRALADFLQQFRTDDLHPRIAGGLAHAPGHEIGRASCRERVCQYV